ASEVSAKLKDMAAVLGRPRAEVFPKQDRLEPTEHGNWINLPYHNVAGPTNRYALDENGKGLVTLAEFLDYAESRVISAAELRAFNARKPQPMDNGQRAALSLDPQREFADGPPCLQH